MLKDARETSRCIDLMFESCENIRDHEGCADCPLRNMCLDDPEVSFMDIFENSYPSLWDEYYNYADHVEFSETERRVQWDEFRREMARDDALLDGWESDD